MLVVDDSALVRKLLSAILSADPEIQVVGQAGDPYEARELIKQLNPHVMTLDVEMPKMDGLTFLRNVMRLRPMPVVMVSSLTERNADVTMAALEIGAVDYIPKPKLGVAEGLTALSEELRAKVKAAAHAKVRYREPRPGVAQIKAALSLDMKTTDRVIAIGSSTGGTEAVADILATLPPDIPGIVIAQHIPGEFSARFATRLNDGSALHVTEAKDGDPILRGRAYVAPGGFHLRVVRSGAKYHCKVTQDAVVNHHRPSVDVLFESVAAHVGASATGVILTGMGADGAAGLLAMKQQGATTIAQDKETSVVWGMPGEAVKRGAADEVLPIESIADRIVALSK